MKWTLHKTTLVFIVWIICLPLITGCSKHNSGTGIQPPTVTVAALTYTDYPYGPDAKMKMDIYLPAGRSNTTTKTLIIIHGGGWAAGDRTDLNVFLDSFKKVLPGWALINVNYPLIDIATGANRHPSQILFIRRAMDTIKNNLGAWGISSKMGMWGVSAGAHLVLMHSYTQNTDGLVKAVCGYMSPTDLRDCWVAPPGPDLRSIVINYTGQLIPNPFGADVYDYASPLYMMPNNAPPTIAFHGAADGLVSVTQSRRLRDKLVQKGIVNEYYEYPGLGHDLWPAAQLGDMFVKMGAFMNKYVQ